MSTKRVKITDATIKGLKIDPKGQGGQEIADKIAPNLRIRPDKTGHSYVYYGRFAGVPTRRTIGRVGRMTLADARRIAREWGEAAAQGRDPKVEERAAREAEAGRITFGQAVEEYIAKQVRRMRQARDAERELRNYLVSRWKDRPLEEISKADVRKLIEEIVDRGAERQAHNIFGLCRTFFNWCVETDRLKFSPCAGLKPRKLIGELRVRTRVLDDTELKAVWQAADKTPYPYGPYIKLLVLTGARKSEAAGATWSEFALDKGTWVVPEGRFKSGVTHRVPLSKDAVALLQDLPEWKGSDLVFSFDGKQSMNGHSKSKARLDAAVNAVLGRECDWQIHDLRRTVRTRLAGLGIPDTVAEQIIGHGRKGLARVYDQHTYESEMGQALELWAARLRSIVTPPPDNVADIAARRARALPRPRKPLRHKRPLPS
jgi:integrase